MTAPVAVTGATGQLGGRVARQLAADGVPLRLLVRDPSRAPQLDGQVEVAQMTYGDGEAVRTALDGIQTVLMVSAGESATRLDEHRSFVHAAAAAGVHHIVYTSFLGASADAEFTLGRDHFHTEQAIIDSGMQYTFLRDNFYADVLPLYADDQGIIRGPAGNGRCSFVVRDDVADVAATVLQAPASHVNRRYDMTGPQALSFPEALAVLTRATGREYRFENETVQDAYASRRASWPGEPDWQYDAWVSTYTAIASGACATVSDDIERLLGRPATSLQQFADRLR